MLIAFQIKNIIINKILVANKVFLYKNVLKVSLASKILKKLDFQVYFSQR